MPRPEGLSAAPEAAGQTGGLRDGHQRGDGESHAQPTREGHGHALRVGLQHQRVLPEQQRPQQQHFLRQLLRHLQAHELRGRQRLRPENSHEKGKWLAMREATTLYEMQKAHLSKRSLSCFQIAMQLY